MSAKWRALQHRHRYTYDSIIFPSSFIDFLSQSPLHLNTKSLPFYTQLSTLISLNSIYSQVSHAKSLASSFSHLLSSSVNGDEEDRSILPIASRCYLQVLFFENSLPLHRTLVSALSKVNSRDYQVLIGKCFRELCQDYESNKSRRFCLSRVALSVMGMPKLGYLLDIIEDCALLVARDVIFGLDSVVSETQEWARPSPMVMEQCQEALSCSYYLLQRFPGEFKEDSISFGGEGLSVMERLLWLLISVLKSTAFSRDCFVAAGVSLCAALQVCLRAEELGLFIFEGIFNQGSCSFRSSSFETELRDVILKVPFQGDLLSEVRSFSVLSRLCFMRGILTAVSRTVLNFHFIVSDNSKMNGQEGNGTLSCSVKTILYDGILPELCDYCENPIDSHFNFHALTVMQICFQQMKTSMLANLSDLSSTYDPIPEVMGTRILRIIWNNLEDPLSQTVKQVHQIFDLFLDIQSTLCMEEGSKRIKIKDFLQKIALDLLQLGSRCKGRYVPLALLTSRLGTTNMLEMSPNLLFETVNAYIDDDVCCAATTFLKCFLQYLRDECWNNCGVEKGYELYRGHCLPPLLYGLASGVSKLRSNLNTYALPILLEVDVDSVFPMLSFISVGPSEEENMLSSLECGFMNIELSVEQKVAVLVSLLKVCRSLALIEGDIDLCDATAVLATEDGFVTDATNLYALVSVKAVKFKVPVEWLMMALTHADELLRVDAAESLFLNPKTSSLPSRLELTLLKQAVPLNMRSCSTGFQMKWTSLFKKIFSRVQTALERQFKNGSWQPLIDNHNNESYSSMKTVETVVKRAENLFKFMRWLCCFLLFSCYPSAPYKRKIMAMELILIMFNIWPIVPPSQDKCDFKAIESCLLPYSKGITSSDSTLLFVGSIVDSWDRLRENSFRILLHFPSPLPGISSEDMVQNVIAWAKNLVCSPRVRESDAGALTLRLIFRKYVLDLGWIIRASADVICFQYKYEMVGGDSQIINYRSPVVEYIKSLIDWLSDSVEEGEQDLSKACKNSFVHGVLLTLRYTFDELDWNSDAIMSSISEMRMTLERLLGLVTRITSLALWVVSADAWYLQDMDEMADDDAYLMNEVDMGRSSINGNDDSKPVQDIGSSEQIVMVGCWLAMKEVSLLLGTIVRKIPLPSNNSEPEALVADGGDASMLKISKPVLDVGQLEEIGNHFLEVLLKMKHNGAIDKTRAGFTALCNRLLCSNDPRLCKLTESWMEQLMKRTVAKGQTVDDLLRRSAGIPAAFIALFLAEPEGAPKKLLPHALRWLIDFANNSFRGLVAAESANAGSLKFSLSNADQELNSAKPFEMHEMKKASKIRDEGVIPTVHAFNILRAAFNDTNLATDTSGFSTEALIISIRSFSSPYWEVRNSACLAYTALVRRMIGFLNVQKRESARRAITGLEFFHRYPSLHPFFYNELQVATDLLTDTASGPSGFNLAKAVHPSLCPMLILLSRLKPSTVASESGDDLDPFLFMPFIRRCSTQSNLRIRVLASKALMGLVSNEKLPVVLLNIASELPSSENQITAASSSPTLVDSACGTYHASSFNLIHGMLLQLSSLLDSNCRNLVDIFKKEKIIGELTQVLSTCSWIANPKWCRCPILNASFLRVLDHILSIARTVKMNQNCDAIRDLLLELSTNCLDVNDSYGLTFYDPTIAELREQAAISYFSCVLQVSKEEEEEETLLMTHMHQSPDLKCLNLPERNIFPGLLERLIHALSDTSYEVRLATLKWLLKFLKSAESGTEVHHMCRSEIRTIQQWTNLNLQEKMLKLLDAEKNNRCMNYILRILFIWNLQQFKKLDSEKCADANYVGTLDFDSMFQFWDKLISLYKLTTHSKTQEMLICCMAVCVKRYASLLTSHVLASVQNSPASGKSVELERSKLLYECITFFVNVIGEHSSASELVSMRKAAAESMIASGLLEQAELIGSSVYSSETLFETVDVNFLPKEAINMYANQVLGLWFTCIKLLEDEDDGVRQGLAMNVRKCFVLKRSFGGSNTGGVPTQVEKVIELSFDYLSSIFGHWNNYFDNLSKWVLNAVNYVVSKGDLVRRVFDKEIDNHHEEKLLICQICCYHLEKLPIVKMMSCNAAVKKEFKNYLCGWRVRFQNQLISFAEDHVDKLGVNWIGGVGNHKDAFLPLYGNLLGYYALSNCIFNGGIEDGVTLLAEVVQLGKTIDPFLRNPLISNLYLSVVKSYKKNVGEAADPRICKSIQDDSNWGDFDPYFLLR